MTKWELHQIYDLKKNIKTMENKLLELESRAMKMTTHMSTQPRGSAEQDRLSHIIAEVVELQDEINDTLRQAYAKEAVAEREIRLLPEREARLIRLRYFEAISWEQICIEMNYSWRQVHYIHASALKLLNNNVCTQLHMEI